MAPDRVARHLSPDQPRHGDHCVIESGLSRSTLYRKIAQRSFPAQMKISTNGAGWRESDINRWIANPVGWRPQPE